MTKKINWKTSLGAALPHAETEDKSILLYFFNPE